MMEKAYFQHQLQQSLPEKDGNIEYNFPQAIFVVLPAASAAEHHIQNAD